MRAQAQRQRLDHHQAAADDLAIEQEQHRLLLDRRPARDGKGVELLLADLVEAGDRAVPLGAADDARLERRHGSRGGARRRLRLASGMDQAVGDHGHRRDFPLVSSSGKLDRAR